LDSDFVFQIRLTRIRICRTIVMHSLPIYAIRRLCKLSQAHSSDPKNAQRSIAHF